MSSVNPLILAIGDSLIAGYGLPATDSFTAQLECQLLRSYPHASVINAGVSGATTGDVLRRLPLVLSRLSRLPDLAVVQAGPNDVLRQIPPMLMRASLDAILFEFGRLNVPVLLTTVDPPRVLRDRARAYLGLHRELAASYDAATCAFFPPDVLGHPAMVLADRVHPNAAAIAAVVDALLQPIITILERGRGEVLPTQLHADPAI